MRRFAKPLYWLIPVPRVRIPPSPPVLLFTITYKAVIPSCYLEKWDGMKYTVNLTKRVKTEDGQTRFYPTVMAANGRVSSKVLVDGEKVERDGTFYIDWNESGKRIRQAVGTDAQKANVERQRQEAVLNGKAVGMTSTNGNDRMLVVAIDEFLDDYRISRAKKTWQQYRTALDYFKQSCKQRLLSDITRRDLLKFAASLRERGLSPRTVANKFEFVMTFLKAQKVTGLLQKGDYPRYTEDEPKPSSRRNWKSSSRRATRRSASGLPSFCRPGCERRKSCTADGMT